MIGSDATTQSKKRSLGYINAQELAWKLKSKEDFIQYLNKHRKYLFISIYTSI